MARKLSEQAMRHRREQQKEYHQRPEVKARCRVQWEAWKKTHIDQVRASNSRYQLKTNEESRPAARAHCRLWDFEQDAKLQQLVDQKLKAVEIAPLIGRTYVSTVRRIKFLRDKRAKEQSNG